MGFRFTVILHSGVTEMYELGHDHDMSQFRANLATTSQHGMFLTFIDVYGALCGVNMAQCLAFTLAP